MFFFDFLKFFSVEIFHMMSTLRMQNYPIIGEGVSALQVRTHRQTDLRIYYIDVLKLKSISNLDTGIMMVKSL